MSLLNFTTLFALLWFTSKLILSVFLAIFIWAIHFTSYDTVFTDNPFVWFHQLHHFLTHMCVCVCVCSLHYFVPHLSLSNYSWRYEHLQGSYIFTYLISPFYLSAYNQSPHDVNPSSSLSELASFFPYLGFIVLSCVYSHDLYEFCTIVFSCSA